MDIALVVEQLRPAAQYSGSVTANTVAAWNLVVWGTNYKPGREEELMLKPTWEELESAWVALSNAAAVKERLAAIDARLAELDTASVRPLRAIVEGSATEADKDRLATIERAAEALRVERKGLEGRG